MLHFEGWKAALIWMTCALGLWLALPNVFYSTVELSNDAAEAIEAGRELTPEEKAGQGAWPSFMADGLLNLGLDLRGGVHLVVEVAVEDVHDDRMQAMWPEARDRLRALPDVRTVRRQPGPDDELRVKIDNPAAMQSALSELADLSEPVMSALLDTGQRTLEVFEVEPDVIGLRLTDAEKRAMNDRTLEQSLEIIRRRVDEAGTREPSIQRQGERRVVIQVPGLGSAEELLAIIGKTAKLTFHPVKRAGNAGEAVSFDEILIPDSDTGSWLVLDKTPVVGGDSLTDAQPGFDQNGLPAVNFRFDPVGARAFGDYTRENIGSLFAIVLDNEVISAPRIISHIPGGSGQITGNFSVESATSLAILLRAGALPAAISVLEQRTVGPELGQDSIEAGRIACIIAFAAVMVFMVLSYGRFGLFADAALIINMALIFGVLSLLGATLTLPGIAGIVLTIGMAVDANVLIFERIREELRAKRGIARAIETGYERALSAIMDANVTTLIAAVILFGVGSGPVRGFAVTLGIGIVTSVFTAFFVTRLLVAIWFKRAQPKALEV